MRCHDCGHSGKAHRHTACDLCLCRSFVSGATAAGRAAADAADLSPTYLIDKTIADMEDTL